MYRLQGRTTFEEWLVQEKRCLHRQKVESLFVISLEGFVYRYLRYRTKGCSAQKDVEKGRKEGSCTGRTRYSTCF